MNRFKIGQEVLIKAHVIDNNLNNLKLNIDKASGSNETINYVDVDSVVNEYMTTEEFIKEIESLEINAACVKNSATVDIIVDELVKSDDIESSELFVEKKRIATIHENRVCSFRLDYEIDRFLVESTFSQEQVIKLTELIVKYTQTPVERRV